MAIAVTGSVSTDTTSAATSITLTGYSLPSDADTLIIAVGSIRNGTTPTFSGVTLDPGGADEQAATEAVQVTNTAGDDPTCAIFYISEANLPAAGSYDIRASCSYADEIGIVVYALTGTDGSAPEVTGSNTENDGNNLPVDVTVTTLTDGAMTVEVGVKDAGGDAALSPADGQTEDAELYSAVTRVSLNLVVGHKEVASAGSITHGWQLGTDRWQTAVALAAFAPAGGSTPIQRILIATGAL